MSVTSNQLAVSSESVATTNELPVTNTKTPPDQISTSEPQPQNSITGTPAAPQIPSMGKLRSTASIGKPLVQQAAQVVSQMQEPVIQQNKSFSESDLRIYWDKFTNDLPMENRMTEYVIFNRKFRLEGTVIHLEVDNDIQLEKVVSVLRNEMISYLRKQLQNTSIQLEVVVAEQENTTLIYTQADKFKFLAEKNPALNELRSVLGLDYDY